jgi:hypothetical protein
MRTLAIILLFGALTACATKPVPCDKHLTPINPPGKAASTASSTGTRP